MHHVVHRVIASRSVLRTSMLVILIGAFWPHSALAQQAPANQSAPQVISCVSTKGQRQVCTAVTAAGVALLRSTGESSCLLGKTWGYDDAGIWVFDGCGGEFALGSTGEATGASDFVGTFEPYGQLRTHLAGFNNTAEVQDNATRFGINFATRGKVKVIAGVEWGVDETAQRLIHRKLIEPLIIVAVANIGEERLHEYAPTPAVIEPKDHPRKHSRGLARIYGQFLIEELKPFIDRKYRTKPEAESTALGGSSLGGLATLAIGIFYSEVFTRLIVMSPSIWWDDYAIFRLVGILGEKPPLKIWLDTGTAEPGWELTRELCKYLVDKGWRPGVDLAYLEVKGADHSEAAWAARVEPALRFLFAARK